MLDHFEDNMIKSLKRNKTKNRTVKEIMAIFQINCCGPKLETSNGDQKKSIDSEIFTKYWIRERIDNGAHISGLSHSMNHRRGTDDENVEFEVPMEHRGGYV